MKILYHHRTASKDGQAVHIEEMVSALRDAGHVVRVVAPEVGTSSQMGEDLGWVQRLKARLPKAAYELMELGYSLVAYRRLARAIRGFSPDVIYERYNLYLLAGLMAKRRFSLPLLLEVNAPLAEERSRFGGLGLERLARWSERMAWSGANVVLPVTHVLSGHISACGVPEDRIRVIPNGINEAHFQAAPNPEEAREGLGLKGALVLGFTGFVRDWHGVDRVVRWLASGSAPVQACLLVVGDGPARSDIERLAGELGVAQRVSFTGFVAREKIPPLVAAFDIALQPAVVPYASPLKLFEYLALGKAIVAPRMPNLEEVLADGSNALLFDPEDPRSLPEALTRMSRDAELRAVLGRAAAQTIRDKGLTWAENARCVSALCQQLTTPSPAESPLPYHRAG